MSDVAKWTLPHTRRKEVERGDQERLEQAERDLRNLKTRAYRAIRILEDRRARNHWQMSIDQMIRGIQK